ncbi:hypothetical protein SVAN01_00274 [Stagonosporopsis vannaccii]|nr:hypothetical protein SVAN01_00274 [Stagonosporopsis vannaccii]
MGDLHPPPLATADSSVELVFPSSERSAVSSLVPRKTASSPHSTPAKHVQPHLGRGSAMFSTDLGRRAPRKLQGPSYVPVIVRSNMVADVVNAAGHWRSKYPFHYLCIFPHAGWKISDLWDEEDIHLETESFCKQVLQFIERDNSARARKYAQDWSYMYPERLPTVGGDMTRLYDKSNPLSIVEKIFVNEESREYPPIFLWHVAHIMRTAMLAAKGIYLPAEELVTVSEAMSNGNTTPALVTVGPMGTVTTASATTSKTSTHESDPTASMSSSQPITTRRKSRKSTPSQGCAVDSNWTASYGAPMAHGQYASGSDPAQSALRVPRTRAGHSASETYKQPMGYVENMPRMPSGFGSRQHAGAMPMMQSPRYNQAHMAMTQPMGNFHPNMMPITNEQTPIPPGMITGPPQPHDVTYPSMMPPHTTRVPSTTHGYSRQPLDSQGAPYAAPMGDMTNIPYPLGIPPQSFGSQQNFGSSQPISGHFNQRCITENVLYDPYDGNNPAFMGSGYSNSNSRKIYPNNYHNSNGRPRKTSFPGNRPYQGQYMHDRPALLQSGGRRYPVQKPYLENDPAITQDREYGCYENWIGPRNETVNELHVKDLPEDIEPSELEAMFYGRLSARPTSINIKSLPHPSRRRHAFVGFSNVSIAKQGILICDATIRSIPVSITVPRRFFQKTVEIPSRDAVEARPASYSRYTSNPNNSNYRSRGPSLDTTDGAIASRTVVNESTSYSPQDARSDMHKKKGKQSQQDTAAGDSPKARNKKSKKHQESPIKKSVTESTEAVSTAAAHLAYQTDDGASSSNDAAAEPMPASETQTQQSCVPSLDPVKLALATEAGEQVFLDETSSGVEVKGTINAVPSITTRQPQHPATELLDSQNKQSTVYGTGEKSDQDRSSEVLAEHTSNEQFSAPTDPLDPKDEVSSEELNNDPTLRSAPEPVNAEMEPMIGSNTTNQGMTLKVSDAVRTTSRGTSEPSVPPLVPAAVAGEPHISAKTVTLAPSDSPVAEAFMAMQQHTTSVTAGPAVLEPAKKSGAQQTESLHPFSKSTKAQAKKEKEQKKKALKKEKEQAEKAKATKSAAGKVAVQNPSENESTTKVNDNPKPGVEGEAAIKGRINLSVKKDSSISDGDDGAANASIKRSTSASNRTADGRTKPGKRKGKNISTPATLDPGKAEKEGEEHGKHIGGTVSTPNELSSVTNKEVKGNLLEDGPASDAQSPKSAFANEASSAAKKSSRTVKFADEPSPAAKKRKNKTKKKKKAPAWPDLEFRPKSPNPSWMGPIDMATDVQCYDEIMNRACGGEDDSDYSWSDIPLLEDEMSYDEEELEEGDRDDDEKDLEAIKQRIAELSGQQAVASSMPVKDTAASSLNTKISRPNVVIEEANERPAVAVLETQLATKDGVKTSMNNLATDGVQLAKSADTQAIRSARVSVAQTSKKKKPNNRKNKKKRAAESAEMAEASQAGGAAKIGDTTGSNSNVIVEDLIDSNDPFYDQLKEIEDTKRGDQGAINLRGGHAEATELCDESQLMRTMEAYFKESQGSRQSEGRKASNHDLYN